MASWRDGGCAAVFRFLVLLTLFAAQSGCWEGTKRETVTTVLSIEGLAEVSSDSGHSFSELQLSQHPGKNQILRTSSTARLCLAVLPNGLIQLDPDSSIEIVRAGMIKDGNETGADIRERFANLKLTRGRILISHVWGEAIARFTIVTAHGEAIVNSNALFSVETSPAQTRVTCASGSLAFRANEAAEATRLGPGFTGESSGTAVKLTPAETDPAAQDIVVELLEAEQKLRDLASRNRNVLPR